MREKGQHHRRPARLVRFGHQAGRSAPGAPDGRRQRRRWSGPLGCARRRSSSEVTLHRIHRCELGSPEDFVGPPDTGRRIGAQHGEKFAGRDYTPGLADRRPDQRADLSRPNCPRWTRPWYRLALRFTAGQSGTGRRRPADRCWLPIALLESRLQAAKANSVVQAEAARGGAAQPAEMRAAAQPLAQVMRQRANVGAGRAVHIQRRIPAAANR